MKQEIKLVKYYGIADAHGIESFLTEEKEAFGNEAKKNFNRELACLMLRASLNRQRHAVFYMAELDRLTVSIVKKYIDQGDFKKALVAIKNLCVRYGFPTDVKDEYQVSWDLIPNDKLDPYCKAGWDTTKQNAKDGEVAIGG